MAEIENALPPPSFCDNCRSLNVELITNEKLYGKIFGRWPYVYRCKDCNSTVGCHPNTFNPLGLMADKKTRLLRKDAHIAFDPLWQSGLMSRSKAYFWLAEVLNIAPERCHISWLSKRQLITTISEAKKHFEENQHIATRRREKQNEQRKRQRQYEKTRIRIRKTGG